jgi:hypothetical protein
MGIEHLQQSSRAPYEVTDNAGGLNGWMQHWLEVY